MKLKNVIIVDISEDLNDDIFPTIEYYCGILRDHGSLSFYDIKPMISDDISWIDPEFIDLSNNTLGNHGIHNIGRKLRGIFKPYLNRIFHNGVTKLGSHNWKGVFTSYSEYIVPLKEFMSRWISLKTYPTGKYVLYDHEFVTK